MSYSVIDFEVREAMKRSIMDLTEPMTKEEYDAKNRDLLDRLRDGEDTKMDLLVLNARLFYRMVCMVKWPEDVDGRELENIAVECAMNAINSLADEADENKFTIPFLAQAAYQQALIMVEAMYTPCGVKISHYERYTKKSRVHGCSLNARFQKEDGVGGEFMDYLHERNKDPRLAGNVTDVYSIEDQVLEEMDMQVIAAELGKMDEETKYIISEYLGFNGEKHRSFLDIAGDLGVSRSTVSRAYNAAIEQIRGALGIKVTDGVMQPAV
jgi:hypothetical protein